MEKSKRMGMIIGSIGCVLGGLLWILVLGISVGSYRITVVPIILAAFCVLFVINFSRTYPERFVSIIGLVILLVASANMVFLNCFYSLIPDQVGGITTGKDMVALPILNALIAFFVLAGILLIVRDGRKK